MQEEKRIKLADAMLLTQQLCPSCRNRMMIGLARMRENPAIAPSPLQSPLHKILQDVAEETGWPASEISNANQEKHLVDARKEFAKRARAKGYSLSVIGRAINRHHTTILHYLKGNGIHG